MFDLGTQELIVIFIVAFLVFGPKKLPELGRTLGKGIRELKIAMRNVRDSIEDADGGITKDLKEAKSNIQDSIYKSIETNINKLETEKDGPEKENPIKDPAATPETAETAAGKEKPASRTCHCPFGVLKVAWILVPAPGRDSAP